MLNPSRPTYALGVSNRVRLHSARCIQAVSCLVLATLLVALSPASPSPATIAEQEKYVTRVFEDLLLRHPTETELNIYAGQLNAASITRGSLLAQILASTEFYELWAIGVYQAYLNRGPTDSEYLAAVAALTSSGDFLTTELSVLTSATYFAAQGSSNEGYVVAVYEDVLRRTAIQADISYWVGRLNTGTTRTDIASYFVRSSESAQVRVRGRTPSPCSAIDLGADDAIAAGSYCLILDRPADQAGFDYWWPRLASTDQLPSLWRSLAASIEYFTLAQG